MECSWLLFTHYIRLKAAIVGQQPADAEIQRRWEVITLATENIIHTNLAMWWRKLFQLVSAETNRVGCSRYFYVYLSLLPLCCRDSSLTEFPGSMCKCESSI